MQNAGRHRPNGYGGGQFARSAAALFRPVTDEDLQRDAEYTPLSVRLNTLRELREKYVSILSALLESRESYQTNYDNAMQCYKYVFVNLFGCDIKLPMH